MTWLEIADLLVVGFLFALLVLGAAWHLRDAYRREGYERGAKDQLEDELRRKAKMIAGRERMGR